MAMKDRSKERDENGPHRGVYLLPNIITTSGLFAGVYSILASVRGDYWVAAAAILVANVCDILDGRVARMTRTSTRFGTEYDSLADVIAFGVAPGILVYTWALQPWGTLGWLAASTYVACGALRLARFNVQYESTEKKHFLGLPIPAAAEVIASLVLLYYFFGGEGETHKRITLLMTTFALAGLMVSNFRYLSFKENELLRRQPFWSLVAVIIVLALLVALPQVMLFLSFGIYAASAPCRWVYLVMKRGWTSSHRGGRSGPDAGEPAAPAAPSAQSGGRPRVIVGGRASEKS
jgi:CDP-diacylglycerol--serine O-phosphatidyltransferase